VCDERDLQGIWHPIGGAIPGAAEHGDDLAFLAILASSACLDTDRSIGRTMRAYAAVLGIQGPWGFCGVFGS
jgi:hypothetical protein